MVLFSIIVLIAISVGAIYSAFSAKNPTRVAMWFVSYLVLIIGVMQAGLLYGLYSTGTEFDSLTYVLLTLFNIGNIAVICGRLQKGKWRHAYISVTGGGLTLSTPAVIMSIRSYTGELSLGYLVLLATTLTLVISMSIGVKMFRDRPAIAK